MSFLYPGFLFGLLALSIPVVIHLFHFRKTKKVYFSNTRFLQNLNERRRHLQKLKYLLVLLCRLLFLFFLVMTFAQPFISTSESNDQKRSVYIYLDNSLSMGSETDEGMRVFDQGANLVNEITGLYDQNTRYKLLTNELSSFSRIWKTKNQVREKTTELDLSPVSRSLTEIADQIHRDRGIGSKEVYIISDFQKATAGTLAALRKDTLTNYYLVPITSVPHSNVYVDSIYLKNPSLNQFERNELQVILRNSGNQDIKSLPVKLFVNDIRSAQTLVDIPAGGIKNLNIGLNFSLKSQNVCRVSFDEHPVTYDNDFYFILNLNGPVSIVEIKDPNAGNYISNVFANDTLFNLKSYSLNNIEYNQITKANLVVLNGLNAIEPSLQSTLLQYLSKGGNITLIPGENADPSSFQKIAGVAISQADPSRVKLSPPDMSNPFYENIFEGKEAFTLPDAKRILTWSNRSGVLLKFADEKPFLSAFSPSGKIYLFSTPFRDEYTTFHKHAVFVLIMYKMAFTSGFVNERLYYRTNDNIVTLPADSIVKNQVYKIKGKDLEFIPSQRVSTNELTLEIPSRVMEAGYYNLILNDKTVNSLAFNLDKSESQQEQFTDKELKEIFGGLNNVKVTKGNNMRSFASTITEVQQGTKLWKYALLLSLIFLLGEVLILRFLR